MNKAIISGRLTRDPDIRATSTGIKVAAYTIAVDRWGSDKADFISCKAFDKRAEFVEKYLKTGTKVIVEGHIQTGDYTDKNGRKVYTTDVIVDSHEFCESKKAAESEHVNNDDFMSVAETDEDLPFA